MRAGPDAGTIGTWRVPNRCGGRSRSSGSPASATPCCWPSSTAADYSRPDWAWVVIAVMTAWTVATTVAYARPERRTPLLLGADLAVTAGLLLSTAALQYPSGHAARGDAGDRDLGGRAGAGLGGPVRPAGGRDRRPDHVRLRLPAAQRGDHRGPQRRGAAAAGRRDRRPPGPARRRGGGGTAARRSRSRRPAGSGNAWPATSTTRCCRCWRWCSGGAPRRAARRPNSAGWRASRKPRCVPWWERPRRAGGPVGRTWTCARWSCPRRRIG